MKAIVCKKSGTPDVLELKEVEKPTPRNSEVLVKIHAGTVTRGDVHFRKIPRPLFILMRMFGFRRKKIPGHELSGEVEAVGRDVTRFKQGDQVFGTSTGLSSGGNAEYICLPEEWKQGVLAIKPSNMTFEEAAAVPVGAMTALHLLKKGGIHEGQKVLVYGASGSVGTFAVQLAKAFGAEVTAVCSTGNLDMVRSIGAAHVIDHTQEDFTRSGDAYDIIFDAVGKISASGSKNSLRENGTFVSVKSLTKEKLEYMAVLRQLIGEGKVKSVIDRRFPLEQVAEAHRYVEKGHKKGNVVITVVPTEKT